MEGPTHYLECFEYCGKNIKRRYWQTCKVLKALSDGRVTVLVYHPKKGDGDVTVRYVKRDKLIPIYEQCKNQ